MELIKIENNQPILDCKVALRIANFEREIKRIKEKEDELKSSILKAMEKNNLLQVSSDELQISYIAPSTRETFDSKLFREKHTAMYDEFVKLTDVKSSIRIKLK